ncbi:HD domain-containing protein [Actinomycetospora cinnamomea]|uniref:HD domain-containing protein n=1 Tax=Actinomycetospora cinnamomea TaxID=663609 RepID=A0A2U1FCS6_9PSEU|nr:HD domain-containing protein [Actinomycetospora cinnamomea]PVZ09939.1 HD domain-containing protein [Actinomycetospora cinnamomea]
MTAGASSGVLPAPSGPSGRYAAVPGLLREVGDLKRVRTADAEDSMAARAFVRAWAALVEGADPVSVADAETAAAVAGARLAGIDAGVLALAGLTADEARAVRDRAIDEVAAGVLHPTTLERLHAAPDPGTTATVPPAFVGALCRQPRAGATAPGRPRLIIEPPEDHGEHCWAVAVYGALLAEDHGADRGEAFLLGLAHHLHNAAMPDAGFAGEMLLGEHLEAVVDRLAERELATLPGPLADRVRGLLAARADAHTPLGATFHAADVLDRVLQVHHHARAAAFTAREALVDLELVHASPVQAHQNAVLDAAGLLP